MGQFTEFQWAVLFRYLQKAIPVIFRVSEEKMKWSEDSFATVLIHMTIKPNQFFRRI